MDVQRSSFRSRVEWRVIEENLRAFLFNTSSATVVLGTCLLIRLFCHLSAVLPVRCLLLLSYFLIRLAPRLIWPTFVLFRFVYRSEQQWRISLLRLPYFSLPNFSSFSQQSDQYCWPYWSFDCLKKLLIPASFYWYLLCLCWVMRSFDKHFHFY